MIVRLLPLIEALVGSAHSLRESVASYYVIGRKSVEFIGNLEGTCIRLPLDGASVAKSQRTKEAVQKGLLFKVNNVIHNCVSN